MTYPEFKTETDQIRYTVHADGIQFPVASYEFGIMLVRDYMRDGIMARLVTEKAYYCKYAWAMGFDGHFLYKYSLVWEVVN